MISKFPDLHLAQLRYLIGHPELDKGLKETKKKELFEVSLKAIKTYFLIPQLILNKGELKKVIFTGKLEKNDKTLNLRRSSRTTWRRSTHFFAPTWASLLIR